MPTVIVVSTRFSTYERPTSDSARALQRARLPVCGMMMAPCYFQGAAVEVPWLAQVGRLERMEANK